MDKDAFTAGSAIKSSSFQSHQIVFQNYVNDVLTSDERIKHVTQQIDLLTAQWAMKPVFDALRTMRGVSTAVAATVLAVTGNARRFQSPRQLMAYFGLVPSEHSSGATVQAGDALPKPGITKCAVLLVQAAWAYRLPSRVSRVKVRYFITKPATLCAPSPGKRRFASIPAIAA